MSYYYDEIHAKNRAMLPIKVTTDIFKLFYEAFRRMLCHDGLMAAGHIAFNAFLSLFPFMIFLAAAAGFLTSPDDVPRIIDFMFKFMPVEVAEALAPTVTEIISIKPAGLLTFGFLATLWTSSTGIEALRIVLNRAYNIKVRRPLWRRRIQSIFLIIFSGLCIFFISILVVLGPLLWSFLTPILYLGILETIIFDAIRYSFSFFIMMAALMILHKYLPNRAEHNIYKVYPGAILTTIIFIIGGTLFSEFIHNFSNLNAAYGSLGSVMLTLIFFYFTAILFIFGAYFNVELHNSKKESQK
jgi:membrane protein